jgi:hypothetical protein
LLGSPTFTPLSESHRGMTLFSLCFLVTPSPGHALASPGNIDTQATFCATSIQISVGGGQVQDFKSLPGGFIMRLRLRTFYC